MRAAFIWGPRVLEGLQFIRVLRSIRGPRLFEGGVYLRAAFIWGRRLLEGRVYLRAAFIWGPRLLEGGVYLRAAFIWGRRLFEGGVYLRAAFIWGRGLFEGGVYLRAGFIRKYGTSILIHEYVNNILFQLFVLFWFVFIARVHSIIAQYLGDPSMTLRVKSARAPLCPLGYPPVGGLR